MHNFSVAVNHEYDTGRRSTFEFPGRGQLFRSQFVLHLALWTGLVGATTLTLDIILLKYPD